MEAFQDQEGLLNQADTRHGHLCPFVSLGVKEGQYAMTTMNRRHTVMEVEVAIVECNHPHGARLHLGNNALIFGVLGKIAVTVARREDGQGLGQNSG